MDHLELWIARAARRSRLTAREDGFTLIEAVLAMSIFAVVLVALAGVLTSSIAARSTATQRSTAEEIANSQLEFVRSISYANVGVTTNGNPVGIVDASGNQASQGGPTVPTGYLVKIKISWVDDSIPTSPATKANYKLVTVTVYRARDSKLLTQQTTQIGPRQRAPYGGINKGIVNVKVTDFYPTAVKADVLVTLSGPTDVADTSDANGVITFPALDPATGSTYYDLDIPPFNGYIMLPDPTVTHFQLAAASSTPQKNLQVYKPVTLTAAFKNSDGTPFVGTVLFTVSSSRGSKSYTYTGTPVTVTTITNSTTGVTEQLVPAVYTITVTNQVAASFYTDPVTQSVPASLSNYPTDLAATATVTADPLGTLSATVTAGGSPVAGATVTVSGGPRSIPTRTATTNASGVASISSLPAGGGYTVTAAKGAQSAPNQTASISGGSTTNLSFVFPTGTLKARVTVNGTATSGATVTLTGGAGSVSLSGSSDVNGEVLFINLPVGSGYTLTASKSGQSASASPTIVASTTTTTIVPLPISVLVTVTWGGANVSGATVSLSGGPSSLSTISATSDVNGQVTFTNVPPGAGYTLLATKSGQTTTLTSQTFTTFPTTNATITLPTGTLKARATISGVATSGATITLTGGPTGLSLSGTSDVNGEVLFSNLPAGTGYTLTATKSGESATASPTVVASTTTTTILPLPIDLVVTVTWAGTIVNGATVTLSGGPGSLPTTNLTTGPSGQVTFTNILPGAGYTLSATKSGSGQTTTLTSQSYTTFPTTNATITLPTKTLTINVKRNSGLLPTNTSVDVSITGGPIGTLGALPKWSGTYLTTSTGDLSAITVPLGNGGAGSYTVKVSLTNCSSPFTTFRAGSATSVNSTTAGNTSVPINFTSSGAACPFSPLP